MSTIHIVGDLGDGAYGTTLILELRSSEAARWLSTVLLRLADGGGWVDVATLPEVRLRNVSHLVLSRVAKPAAKRLRLVDGDRLYWTGTTGEWRTACDLLEGLADGRSRHQYLSEERYDDVLVVVSQGEHHLGLSSWMPD